MRRLLVAVLTMLVLGGLASSPAAAGADKPRPFNVSIESVFTPGGDCAPGIPRGLITGTGTASHLGRITVSGFGCQGADGEITWTAANGDAIMITFTTVVTGPPNSDGSLPVILPDSNVEGTGRFEGVAFVGDAELTGTLTFDDPSGLSGRLDAELRGGLIQYDASNRRH